MTAQLIKAGANWVDGARFFDREAELEELRERVRNGAHTLLTAQRRMGKTSLVRELLRQLEDEGSFATVFVDLEAANDPADAVAEIAIRAKPVQTAWRRIGSFFANHLRDVRDHIDEVAVSEIKVKLRAGIDAGNWQHQGDQVFAALASSERPVVLAIDELPILVNRLLKGADYRVTAERTTATDELLAWLRKNAQEHRGAVILILSGSVGLEPVLRQAGLSAHANIYSPLELHPWSHDTSSRCLAALARTYDLDLSEDVRSEICRRLRCCVPHHVQQFFDYLHQHLRRKGTTTATTDDVHQVYERDFLGVRGQVDLEHYEGRLRMVLGVADYTTALALLTEAAVNDGLLTHQAIRSYRDALASSDADDAVAIENILYSLEHDGYLQRRADGYEFVSGLLQDWWRARHGQYFTPIEDRPI
ncbi:MAG: AAA family ATPase [Chloroflexota bacterium]|nr:AAA family ATPase [Chloroflexota bacterium]